MYFILDKEKRKEEKIQFTLLGKGDSKMCKTKIILIKGEINQITQKIKVINPPKHNSLKKSDEEKQIHM